MALLRQANPSDMPMYSYMNQYDEVWVYMYVLPFNTFLQLLNTSPCVVLCQVYCYFIYATLFIKLSAIMQLMYVRGMQYCYHTTKRSRVWFHVQASILYADKPYCEYELQSTLPNSEHSCPSQHFSIEIKHFFYLLYQTYTRMHVLIFIATHPFQLQCNKTEIKSNSNQPMTEM